VDEGFCFDFERPLVEIEKKIADLKAFAEERDVDLSDAIRLLEERKVRKIEEIFSDLTPWQRVQLARHPQRPVLADYIRLAFDDFVELHGDRCFGDDRAIVCGPATIRGEKVMLVGNNKGKDTKERMESNFGMPHPEGYRKALQKMKLAEKYGMPVLCVIDTPGAYPGIAAEERGQAVAIAENLMTMSDLKTPVVSVVIGEGGSGGALGIAVADCLLVLQNAYFSVISPEGCAAILWKSAEKAEEAAKALRLTAAELLELGIIDGVVPEPPGGAHRDHEAAARALGDAVTERIAQLRKQPVGRLTEARYEKYRRMGVTTSAGGEG
jgi:acetyl-CoA carboxylase carboxyl transferase subunit alpha